MIPIKRVTKTETFNGRRVEVSDTYIFGMLVMRDMMEITTI